MKLIIAFIKPFKLEQVRDAVKAAGVSGMSVTDVSRAGDVFCVLMRSPPAAPSRR